jgi:hypothetical protein
MKSNVIAKSEWTTAHKDCEAAGFDWERVECIKVGCTVFQKGDIRVMLGRTEGKTLSYNWFKKDDGSIKIYFPVGIETLPRLEVEKVRKWANSK